MVVALLIIVLYVLFIWLVFFKLRLLQFSIAWGGVSVFVGLHLLLIFLIGLRFVTYPRLKSWACGCTPRVPSDHGTHTIGRMTSALPAILIAALVSALATCPQETHWKWDWVLRLVLSACPQTAQVRDVYQGST